MKLDKTDALPSCSVNTRLKSAFLHLDKNSDPITYQQSTPSEVEASAINITANVTVQGAPDDIANSEFRFIQFAKTHTFLVQFAGLTARQGSVTVNLDLPPAHPARFSGQFLLDSTDQFYTGNVMPFMNKRPPDVTALPGGRRTVSVGMDDHPNSRLPLSIRNTATNTNNFLFKAILHKEFVTAFVVRRAGSPAGTFEPLRFVVWNIYWTAKFQWERMNYAPTGGADDVADLGPGLFQCRPIMGDRFLVAGGVGKTLEDKALLARFVRPPADVKETANVVNKGAIKALDQRGIANISAYRTWLDREMANAFK